MAQVVYSRNAASSIERLHKFLAEKNPDSAARAVNVVLDRLAFLARFPLLGPVDPDRPDTRQLFISYGAAGYVARYHAIDDTVIVLAIRRMREAGYSEEPPKPRPPGRSSRRRRS